MISIASRQRRLNHPRRLGFNRRSRDVGNPPLVRGLMVFDN